MNTCRSNSVDVENAHVGSFKLLWQVPSQNTRVYRYRDISTDCRLYYATRAFNIEHELRSSVTG